jgi:dipeptidyl aminopeptidase/acylaminoacyl peptidase
MASTTTTCQSRIRAVLLALDAGVETIMIRYRREGHGVRETKHQVDVIDQSAAWYEKRFQSNATPTEAR